MEGAAADNGAAFDKTEQSKCHQACVDRAIKTLGIDMNMKTDPRLIAEILRDDMYLEDLPSAKALFTATLAKPVSLRPMLEQIRRAIAKDQPAVSEFLCAAIKANLITAVAEE